MKYLLLTSQNDSLIPAILSVYKLPSVAQFISIDEKNIASVRLFENAGFVCISKDEELLEYVYIKD